MLIAKSLLRDLCSALGPYCKKCICAEWLVFSDLARWKCTLTATWCMYPPPPPQIITCTNMYNDVHCIIECMHNNTKAQILKEGAGLLQGSHSSVVRASTAKVEGLGFDSQWLLMHFFFGMFLS